MEHKGKKIWTIVLTIYLTIVTIGCGLFGYLYFSSKAKTGQALDAKSLINTVCYDLGAISQEEYIRRSGTGSASAQSVDAQISAAAFDESKFEIAYNKSEMDFTEVGEPKELIYNYYLFLGTARELVYGDQYKEGETYKTQINLPASMGGATIYLTLSYTVSGKSIIINSSSAEGSYTMIVLTEEADASWSMVVANYDYGQKYGSGIGYDVYKGKNYALYYFQQTDLHLDQDMQHGKSVTSASQVELQLKKINVETHKKTLATNGEHMVLPKSAYLPAGTYTENGEYKFLNANMNNTEVVEQANAALRFYDSNISSNRKALKENPVEANIGAAVVEIVWGDWRNSGN